MYKLNEYCEFYEIDKEAIVINNSVNKLLYLNKTATFIFKKIISYNSVEDIHNEIIEFYSNVSSDYIEDVNQIIEELLNLNIILKTDENN